MSLQPSNELESKVKRLVEAIEGKWERKHHGDVFRSMVAILDAQHESIRLQDPKPLDLFVLFDLCFAKGGTSVMADMYLNKGSATDEEAAFGYNFGVALQLLDDVQDVRRDIFDHQQTVCTHFFQYQSDQLEQLIGRLLNFLTCIIEPFDPLPDDVEASLRQAMVNMCYCIVLKAVSKDVNLFSPSFVSTIESYSPIPFDNMKKVVLVKKLLHLVRRKQI